MKITKFSVGKKKQSPDQIFAVSFLDIFSIYAGLKFQRGFWLISHCMQCAEIYMAKKMLLRTNPIPGAMAIFFGDHTMFSGSDLIARLILAKFCPCIA